MEKLEKIFSLHHLFSDCRFPVPLEDILRELKCSKATFFRLRAFLCGMGAPVEFSRKYKGYFYDLKEEECFELPGIWFTSQELLSFAVLDKAVDELSQGLFADTFKPFRAKLDSLIKLQKLKSARWHRGIKLISVEQRNVNPEILKTVASAVLSRQRLLVTHKPLGKEPSQREISPQAIVRYRDNWYTDAWCHKRGSLRTFSIDRFEACTKIPGKFMDVNRKELDSYYGASFGIFTGPPRATAEIKFRGIAAEEVGKEQWHPFQKSIPDPDGSLTLQIPYSDSRELIMDILKWGEMAEVKQPRELREEVRRMVGGMRKIYEKK